MLFELVQKKSLNLRKPRNASDMVTWNISLSQSLQLEFSMPSNSLAGTSVIIGCRVSLVEISCSLLMPEQKSWRRGSLHLSSNLLLICHSLILVRYALIDLCFALVNKWVQDRLSVREDAGSVWSWGVSQKVRNCLTVTPYSFLGCWGHP